MLNVDANLSRTLLYNKSQNVQYIFVRNRNQTGSKLQFDRTQ